jgi:hypothetical protein
MPSHRPVASSLAGTAGTHAYRIDSLTGNRGLCPPRLLRRAGSMTIAGGDPGASIGASKRPRSPRRSDRRFRRHPGGAGDASWSSHCGRRPAISPPSWRKSRPTISTARRADARDGRRREVPAMTAARVLALVRPRNSASLRWAPFRTGGWLAGAQRFADQCFSGVCYGAKKLSCAPGGARPAFRRRDTTGGVIVPMPSHSWRLLEPKKSQQSFPPILDPKASRP